MKLARHICVQVVVQVTDQVTDVRYSLLPAQASSALLQIGAVANMAPQSCIAAPVKRLRSFAAALFPRI
jgi:hypothetical protein